MQELLNDLIKRAECYFDDELIWVKMHSKGKLLLFSKEKYAEQFIEESKAVKERGYLKFNNISFEIQENKKYLIISYKNNL